MAISNYSQLITSITSWMDRADLASFAPDFITLAEEVISRELRVREMESVASITMVSGVGALPTDYAQYRRVTWLGSERRKLNFVDPDIADISYPTRSAGVPESFTIIGLNLYAYPTTDTSVEMVYYSKLPALSETNTTNWLLQKSSGLYLRMSLAMAYDFIKFSEEAAQQLSMARAYMTAISGENDLAVYANAGMTVQGLTP